MIKTWTEEKVQKETVIRHKFCDICGEEFHIGLACGTAKCMYCGKDLCEECICHEEATPADYRNVYCKKCWELGKSYRTTIEELQSNVGKLYKEWQEKCKNGK